MKVNNYSDLVINLVDKLVWLDAEHGQYYTDIYMYVDEEGNASLDEYFNPGGRSWKNDDHIFLYRDNPHYEDEIFEGEDMTTDDIAEELKYLYHDQYISKAWDILDDAGIE